MFALILTLWSGLNWSLSWVWFWGFFFKNFFDLVLSSFWLWNRTFPLSMIKRRKLWFFCGKQKKKKISLIFIKRAQRSFPKISWLGTEKFKVMKKKLCSLSKNVFKGRFFPFFLEQNHFWNFLKKMTKKILFQKKEILRKFGKLSKSTENFKSLWV